MGILRNGVRLFTTATLVAVLLPWLGPVTSASAYANLGCKFSSATVKYGYTASGLQPIFNTAATRWSSSTDVNLVYAGQVSVVTGINPYAANYGSVIWDGQATPCSGSTRTGVAIQLNRYYTDGYTTEKKIGVAVHEFGHALGLAHVSSTSAVMYGNTPGRVPTSPAADDKNGMNALY